MHTGEAKTQGGRFGEAPAVGISAVLREHGFELGRLKTGTPPRLKRSTIRWEELAPQYGDTRPTPFSDLTMRLRRRRRTVRLAGEWALRKRRWPRSRRALLAWSRRDFVFDAFPLLPQVECRQTSTDAASHELILREPGPLPTPRGLIDGPRYCPSIEDKVVRFAQSRDARRLPRA